MVSREPVASILARLTSVITPYPSGALSGAHRDALNRRSDAILKCANEWGKAMKLDESEFSRHQIPKALFDVLDDFDEAAAIIAAETYLSRLGWKIERPRPACDVGK
jgi:hypothetical protein